MIGAAIGAGAGVAGGVMQMIASRLANEEMAQQFQKELLQQQAFRNQGFGNVEQLLPQMGVEQARQDIAHGAQNREQFYAKNSGPMAAQVGGDQRDRASGVLAGKSRAQLGGYSDWALTKAIKMIRTQDQLNRLASFAQGSAQVFPYKMQDAQHSQDPLAGIGSLLSSIGGSAGGFGSLVNKPQSVPYGAGGLRGVDASQGIDAPSGFGSEYGNLA